MKQRFLLTLLIGFLASLFLMGGKYSAKRFCSPLVYGPAGRAFSEEYSQDQFNEWAMEVGHSGVGLYDRILCLDMRREDKDVSRIIRMRPNGLSPDTLWFAAILPERWTAGEKSYVCVVRGVEVPTSVHVVLVDGSSFDQPVERKRK
jgi:hypothetical protein